MRCPHCGNDTPDQSPFCRSCGAQLMNPAAGSNPFADTNNPFATPQFTPPPAPPGQGLGDDAALRWVLPVGRSIFAIISGYCGLCSLGCCPLGPVAVITGILALLELKKKPHLSGKGRAIFGIITGTLGTLGLVAGTITLLMSK